MLVSFRKRNKNLFDENEKLKRKFENMESFPNISIKSLISENKQLNEKICDLKKINENFTNMKRNFQYMLSKQRSIFNKEGVIIILTRQKIF